MRAASITAVSAALLVLLAGTVAAEDMTMARIPAIFARAIKDLDLKRVSFRVVNCEQGASFVCDVTGKFPMSMPAIKFLAVAATKEAVVGHFDFSFSSDSDPVPLLVSIAVATTAMGGEIAEVADTSKFVADLMTSARESGHSISQEFRGTNQTVSIIPGAGALLVISRANP